MKRVCIAVLLTSLAGSLAAQDSPKEEDFPKKVTETRFTDVIATDSLPAAELLKRAVNFIKIEHQQYKKTAGSTSGSKAEFIASFPVKPKELNPEVDYTGKITMKVLIECKSSKYRYTVSDIRHLSKNGRTTAGSIDNPVPECGSMAMNDIVWKKLRGEALRDANVVVNDLKSGMSTAVPAQEKGDDW